MALRILLADDSMVAQNMGKKILTDAGYDVHVVSNGAAAVKKLPEIDPDIILLDVYMPGYTGLEVCTRVKNAPQTAHIPVLLTVGKMEPFKTEDGMRVMADGMIIKPFEASDLAAVVGKLAERVRTKPETAPAKPAPEPLKERESVFEPAQESEHRQTQTDIAVAPAFIDDMPASPDSSPAAPEPTAEIEVLPAEPMIDALGVEPTPAAAFELQTEDPLLERTPEPVHGEPVLSAAASDAPVSAMEVENEPAHLEDEPPEAELYSEPPATGANEPLAATFEAFNVAADTAETAAHMAAAAVTSSAPVAMPFAAPAPFGQTSPDDNVIAKAMAAMLHAQGARQIDDPAAQTLDAFAHSIGVAVETEPAAAEQLDEQPAPSEEADPVEIAPLESELDASATREESVFSSTESTPAVVEMAAPEDQLAAEPDALAAQQESATELEIAAPSPCEIESGEVTTIGDPEPTVETADVSVDESVVANDASADGDDALAASIAERVLERLKPQLVEEIRKELRNARS